MEVIKSVDGGGPDETRSQSKKVKEKNIKKLTVTPIRKLQEAPRQSLKKTIKFKIKASNIKPLDSQVAGHGTKVSTRGSNRGMFMYGEEYVLKPVQAAPKGLREVEFYQHISSSPLPLDKRFYSLLPKFHGTEWMKNENISDEQFIILENLTQGMDQPCVMDIKIGATTYGPDAGEEKKRREDSSYLGTKKPLGYSVLGIFSQTQECERIRMDRSFGMNLSTDRVMETLRIFLCRDGNLPNMKLVAQRFVKLLGSYLDFFREQTAYHLFASSLLFVYDFRCMQLPDADAARIENHVRLKLIDLAHVFPANGCRDENFLFGLENLIKLFNDFISSV